MWILVYIAFIISMIAAWATHVVVTILAGQWLLLIAGAILVPLGIFHGYGVWFGFW